MLYSLVLSYSKRIWETNSSLVSLRNLVRRSSLGLFACHLPSRCRLSLVLFEILSTKVFALVWCFYYEEWSFSFFLIGQFQYCFLLFVCGLGFGCFLHLLLLLFIVFLCKRAKNSLLQLDATLNCSCSKRESIKKEVPLIISSTGRNMAAIANLL